MKKIALCAALLLGAALGRADTSTPRMGIVKPTIGSTGWGVKWNENANILDLKAACLTCTNAFSGPNSFSGLTTFTGGTVFSSTGIFQSAIFVGTTSYTPGVSEASDLIFLTGSQPFFLMQNEGVSSKKMGFRANSDGTLTLWNETDGLTIATFDDAGDSSFNSVQVVNNLTFQGTPAINNATNSPLSISSTFPVNFTDGRVGLSGTSAIATIVGTSTGTFDGLEGENFCMEFNAAGACRAFRDAVSFTIGSVDSGTEFTVSGDVTGMHEGATVTQGTHTATVTSFDPETPTALSVDATAGFTAAAAAWSDFVDPDAATVDEVAAALMDPAAFWPGTVNFTNSGGFLSIDSGFNGSVEMVSGGATVYAILGFTVGDQSPITSISHKNHNLTGFLFADDGGPGPWGVWAFSDGRRWLQVDSGATTLYGNISLGNEEFTGGTPVVTVQNDLNVGGNLQLSGAVGPLTVGNEFTNGVVNIVNDNGVQHVRFFSGGGSGGSGEINDAAGATTISMQGDTGNVVAERFESTADGFEFPDNSVQTTAANVTTAALFTSTTTATHTNTTTEASIIGTGIGSKTLPAGFFTPGKTIKITVSGNLNVDASAPGTIQWKVLVGGSTGTITNASDTTPFASAFQGATWKVEAEFTCRTAGVSGTLMPTAMVWTSIDAGVPGLYAVYGPGRFDFTGPVTVDTTGTLSVDVLFDWGTADSDNVARGFTAMIESLN